MFVLFYQSAALHLQCENSPQGEQKKGCRLTEKALSSLQMQGMGGGFEGYDASAQFYLQPGMQGVMGQVRVRES